MLSMPNKARLLLASNNITLYLTWRWLGSAQRGCQRQCCARTGYACGGASGASSWPGWTHICPRSIWRSHASLPPVSSGCTPPGVSHTPCSRKKKELTGITTLTRWYGYVFIVSCIFNHIVGISSSVIVNKQAGSSIFGPSHNGKFWCWRNFLCRISIRMLFVAQVTLKAT